MALRISAFDSKELQATLILLKGMPKELSAQIRKATKGMALPEWQKAVRGRVSTRLESRVLGDTATVAVSNANVRLKSATKGKSLSGGAKPIEIGKSVEYGNKHKQFKKRQRGGYVVQKSASKLIPRFAALWVQTTVRTFYESFEGK